MNKLLINAPSGKQELIEAVAYFDPARVLWDESVNGAIPAITLGGMTRVGNTLVLDSGLLATAVAAALAELKAAFTAQTYTDVAAIVSAVTRGIQDEYALAETEARAYITAGYTGTVPASVSSWATAKGWTATTAANDIAATATSWRSAQASMRATRLLRKEQGANAVDAAALAVIKAQWEAYIIAMRASLGVP